MDDGAIIALYFARDEAAIRETDQKYGPLVLLHSRQYPAQPPGQRGIASTIHILPYGIGSRPPGRSVFLLFSAASRAIYP